MTVLLGKGTESWARRAANAAILCQAFRTGRSDLFQKTRGAASADFISFDGICIRTLAQVLLSGDGLPIPGNRLTLGDVAPILTGEFRPSFEIGRGTLTISGSLTAENYTFV
jgi:hypothetical protein